MKETPLLLLLKLQSNLISGDEAKCFHTYKKMLNFPSSRPVAVRGLISLAATKKDKELFSNILNTTKIKKIPLGNFINEAFYFCFTNNDWDILINHIINRKPKEVKNTKLILGILKYNLAKQNYNNDNFKQANTI